MKQSTARPSTTAARIARSAICCAVAAWAVPAFAAGADTSMPGLVGLPTGGGFADAGLLGQYFPNPDLNGQPAFERRDVRVDFDLNHASAGGSPGEPYKSFPADGFSVRWAGRLLPRFSETYTISATADDGVRVMVKDGAAPDWTTVVDAWAHTGAAQTVTGTFAFTAGKPYDVRVEYRDVAGPAVVKLAWSSPSTPQETIEAASGLATNVYAEGFTDAMKSARDEWKTADGPERDAKRDENGWPMEDAKCMIWEGTDKHEGTYTVQFKGRADLSVQFDYAHFENQSYDAATNTTTAQMIVTDTSRQNFNLIFKNTKRDANADSNTGVTDVRVYLPTGVGSATSYPVNTLFVPIYEKQLQRFVALRFMSGTNWNNSISWADATPVDYSTQHRINKPAERWGDKWETSGFEGNGIAWEYKIALANETGKDLYVCVPEMADDQYITNLAQTLKYGSDGKHPYASPQANPVYPPLNSNLKVYVEYSNEVWNVGFAQWHQNFRAAEEAVKSGTDEAKVLAYDQDDPQRLDANVRWGRRHVLQTVRAANLFRKVFGDEQTNTPDGRVRVLHFWQYDNSGWPPTAGVQMQFLDDYFDNADGKKHVADPHPPSYYVWGAGGATYYNGANERGRTTILKDGSFETPATDDHVEAPAGAGGGWTFTGASGIARAGGPFGAPQTAQQKQEAEQRNGNQPAAPVEGRAAHDDQAAYLSSGGSFQTQVTVPTTGVANVYAVEFSAARKKGGEPQPFDVYVDDKLLTGGNGWEKSLHPGDDWHEYSTTTFNAEPGSTHTVKFVAVEGGGDAKPGALSFVDDVNVTSVDAIFAADIPASGYNGGSGNSMRNYQVRLDGTANWALVHGLRFAAYEGGWALGGDAGGTPVQNWAKFNDPRAKEAQLHAIDAFYKAGGTLNTFGTYSQWTTWDEADGQPLVQGIEQANATLPPGPDGALLLPGELTIDRRVRHWGFKDVVPPDDGKIDARHLLAWFVTAPKAGDYALHLTAAAGGEAAIEVDGRPVATGATGADLSANVSLSPGLHAVRVRARSGSFTVDKVVATPVP